MKAGINTNARILVIADQPANQSMMVKILSKMNFRLVDTANNGPAGLVLFRAGHYDLVLIDGDLAAMGGLEAAKRMRGVEEGLRHTPIIAITSHAPYGDREKCLKSGIDDYIAKPVDAARFQRALLQWVPGDTELPPRNKTFKVGDVPQRTLITLMSDAGNAALEGLDYTGEDKDEQD